MRLSLVPWSHVFFACFSYQVFSSFLVSPARFTAAVFMRATGVRGVKVGGQRGYGFLDLVDGGLRGTGQGVRCVGCEVLSRAVVYEGRVCLEPSCDIRGGMKIGSC